MGSRRKLRRSRKQLSAEPSSLSHVHRIAALGAVLYLAIVGTMVALDRYAFVLKSSIVPLLLVAAVGMRRLRSFVNDWFVLLAAIVLFDALRTLVYASVTHFRLPMYAAYAIDWDRWLCGGEAAPVRAQELRAALGNPSWLDRLFVLLHASHFLFFFLCGFVLWSTRKEAFRFYSAALLILLYVALAIHLLVPTIPPWMAAEHFDLLPTVTRLIRTVYNQHVPGLVPIFDVNPIAAMPSLHAAFPTLCLLLAWRFLSRSVAAGVAVYAVGVWLGSVYLGEHYLVDIVAGVLLAAAAYRGARWLLPAPAPEARAAPGASQWQRLFLRPVAAFSLVVAALLCGKLSERWFGPLPITHAFVERDLIGRTPVAHYFLGRIALEEGDLDHARRELGQALKELRHPEQRKVILSLLDAIGSP